MTEAPTQKALICGITGQDGSYVTGRSARIVEYRDQ